MPADVSWVALMSTCFPAGELTRLEFVMSHALCKATPVLKADVAGSLLLCLR